ncbi:MAG: hypothetical protein CMG16_02400 [Candidatus Marinimicrobia bacterium]|nr:hypothetical protein [Candidatus Neomarinimicrobiota bacterium]|tara:strand:- start:2874 stop:3743 length:870 start_codon:yes stop_codon:yes gene_type:complete
MNKIFKIYIFAIFILLSCGKEGSNVTATTENNNEGGSNAIVYDSKILMELFTSTTCGPCLPQNTTLNRYLDPTSSVYAGDLADEWIILRYHVWWPSSGDPYYDWNQAPVINREAYYDVGYVPHMYTNGNVDSAGTATTWRTNARAAVNQPTFFKIDINGSRNGNNISGNVRVTSSADISNVSGFKLYVAVTHDNSIYNAPNGQTVFDQTFVDFLSGNIIDGQQVYFDTINLGAEETLNKVFNWTMDSNWPNNSGVSWNIQDLNIVAFVQFDGAGQNNKKVYQVEALAFD